MSCELFYFFGERCDLAFKGCFQLSCLQDPWNDHRRMNLISCLEITRVYCLGIQLSFCFDGTERLVFILELEMRSASPRFQLFHHFELSKGGLVSRKTIS